MSVSDTTMDDRLHFTFEAQGAIARLNTVVDRELDSAIDAFSETPLPCTLRQQLRERMKNSVDAWDQALYGVAQTKVTAEHAE